MCDFGVVKRCPRCGETKDSAQFNRSRYNLDGLQSYCRRCDSAFPRPRDEGRRNKRQRSLECPKLCRRCFGLAHRVSGAVCVCGLQAVPA